MRSASASTEWERVGAAIERGSSGIGGKMGARRDDRVETRFEGEGGSSEGRDFLDGILEVVIGDVTMFFRGSFSFPTTWPN